jgi:hypothetical protein
MKKVMFFVLLATGLFFIIHKAQAVPYVYQPQNFGYSNVSMSTGTLAQVINSTAPTLGYAMWCGNCAANGNAGTPCYSTGTANWGQMVLSTGTRCQ